MLAQIIAVGSELLTPARLDTNSLFLTERLARRGIDVVRKVVVGDDQSRIAREVLRAREDAELVIVTGPPIGDHLGLVWFLLGHGITQSLLSHLHLLMRLRF